MVSLAAGSRHAVARTALSIVLAGAIGAAVPVQTLAQSNNGFDTQSPIPPLENSGAPNFTGDVGIRSLNTNPLDPAFDLGGDDLPALVAPYAAPDPGTGAGDAFEPGPIVPLSRPRLVLAAKLTDDGGPIGSGLVWRLFGSEPDPDGELPLIANGAGGSASFEVEPGVYFVYCGFGYAGSTVRVELNGGLREETVVLNAGGLRLRAAADEAQILPPGDVLFDVYSLETDDRGERKVVARDVRPEELVRLAADTYHVVSRYGQVNAQTRGDVEVKPGKLTEVTLYQRAAEVTLKLVGAPGGEAIADTVWSVLTPGGDIVTEGVGAFPSFVLASGEYTVIARHDDKVYQRDFNVETGRDAEVEVLAQD